MTRLESWLILVIERQVDALCAAICVLDEVSDVPASAAFYKAVLEIMRDLPGCDAITEGV